MLDLPAYLAPLAALTAGTPMSVFDPCTGRPLVEIACAGVRETDDAIAAAQSAFAGWSAKSAAARKKAVGAFADAIAADLEGLAIISTAEQGRPLDRARGEILAALAYLRKFLEFDIEPRILRDADGLQVALGRRPLGVVAAITAWNAPVLLAIWKIAPALLAGNTLVVKPSPFAPLATLRLGELGRGVLPPGVLSVICGGAEAGARLSSHPAVRKIAFTGSARTGRHIAQAAARDLKRLTLELGGNDAAIVLDDADPQAIAPSLFWGKFHNSGQVCASIKRLFVHRAIFPEVLGRLVEIARGVKIGSGFEQGVEMGPVQNRPQFDHLQALLARARADGMSIAYQSGVPAGDGYFFPVTILTGAAGNATFQSEEAFGPILPVFPFDDEEEALRLANATEFGLGGSVWSSDFARARALANRLDVGTAWVNQHPAMAPDLPFGGVKQSGIGVEGGEWGLSEYGSAHVFNGRRL